MSTNNINRLEGNGNTIGDNNKVQNSFLMDNETIIRDDANSFATYSVEDNYYLANGHKTFQDELKRELYNYYSTDAKVVFLDEVRSVILDSFKRFSKSPTADLAVLNKMLFFTEQEINELPKILKPSSSTTTHSRTKVFISYCRDDIHFLNELKRHFRPLESIIEFWDDSKILPGKKWKEEIESAIFQSKVAILLISGDFFNSEFIVNNELPPLLKKADEDGSTILSIILKPCLFEEYPAINKYQAINDPKRPISSLDENTRENLWVDLVRQVKKIVSN